MRPTRPITIALLSLTLGLGLSSCRTPSSPGPQTRPAAPPELELEVVPRPLYVAPLLSLRGEHASALFHLNIHNRGARAVELQHVTVDAIRAGDRQERLVIERTLLARRLRPVPWVVMRGRQSVAAAHRLRGALRRAKGDSRIEPGASAALTEQLLIGRPEHLPDRLRITVDAKGARRAIEVAVQRYEQKTPLRLPLRGPWWVMAGHRFDEHHGDAVLLSQSFAYDLGLLGAGGATLAGDPAANRSYHAHGQPILAAAAGEVVRAHDGIPENRPVGRRPTWHEILRRPLDLGGNHVVLRHDSGEHSAYLHLMPGLKVQVGDRVAAGQELGACGNSGNSLESHLHFQLQDGPDLLRAVGLPARFGDFTIHLGHLRLYVPITDPQPLPSRLVVEPGRAAGAVEFRQAIAP